jgi:hypothetical protein
VSLFVSFGYLVRSSQPPNKALQRTRITVGCFHRFDFKEDISPNARVGSQAAVGQPRMDFITGTAGFGQKWPFAPRVAAIKKGLWQDQERHPALGRRRFK